MTGETKSEDEEFDAHGAERKVSALHSTLHHYTNWEGLEGILKSQSLWATFYKDLNDLTEFEHLRDFLIEAVGKRLRPQVIVKANQIGTDAQKLVRSSGGAYAVARAEATRWVEQIYRTTFQGGADGVSIISPYVISFCTHARDRPYEESNGLLSQWRAYGGTERYSLVFNTRKLEALCEEESEAYGLYLRLISVVYNEDVQHSSRHFSKLVDLIEKVCVSDWDREWYKPDALLEEFAKATCRFKHRGFKEEREIRIVAYPETLELKRRLKSEYEGVYEDLPEKSFFCSLGRRRHIAINESGQRGALPVSRIIIGPNKNQELLKEKVLIFLSSIGTPHIPVLLSETPFRG